MYNLIEKSCAIICFIFGVLMLVLPLDSLKKMKFVKEDTSAKKTKVLGGIMTVLGILTFVLFFINSY